MYVNRGSISQLYAQLVNTHTALSDPVLILVAAEPDALCACRILTSLLRGDYIQHNVRPVGGYADLWKASVELIQPMRTTQCGSGGVVVCLGVGGLVDLEEKLGLESDGCTEAKPSTSGMGGVSVWLIDSRRPYNLTNVFGASGLPVTDNPKADEIQRKKCGIDRGCILSDYRLGTGGVIVFDSGDIEDDLQLERAAYCGLADLGESDEDDDDAISSNEISSDGDGVDNDKTTEESDSDDDGFIVYESDRERGDSIDDESGVPPSNQNFRKRKAWDFHSDIHGNDHDDTVSKGLPRRKRKRKLSQANHDPRKLKRTFSESLSSDKSSTISDFAECETKSQLGSDAVKTNDPVNTENKVLEDLHEAQKRIRQRIKWNKVLRRYYEFGASYGEPVSSMVYSIASELGREDNNLLWYAIVGVCSREIMYQTAHGLGLPSTSNKGTSDITGRVKEVLRDEVRRLNPDATRDGGGSSGDSIISCALSSEDYSIRLSLEPRLYLLRHWTLYDSMLHSPYLAAKLYLWNESGRRKLHKMLAKMGISLVQCRQLYTHMDVNVKKSLTDRLRQFAPIYGLNDLVPQHTTLPNSTRTDQKAWGFVRCWGWKASFSATDVGIVIGAILDIGDLTVTDNGNQVWTRDTNVNTSRTGLLTPSSIDESFNIEAQVKLNSQGSEQDRFFQAYDALSATDPTLILSNISAAQYFARAILRTGTGLIDKRQIKSLRAFRMAILKDGPDLALFCRVGPLLKLAGWILGVIREIDGDSGKTRLSGKLSHRVNEFVLAGLDTNREVYVVVGLGGGTLSARQKRGSRSKKSVNIDSEADSDTDLWDTDSDTNEVSGTSKRRIRYDLNRFGNAFLEAADEIGAAVKKDSFEHCVVEVAKNDLMTFLESLSFKSVVGP